MPWPPSSIESVVSQNDSYDDACDVHPDERGDGRREQDRGAARLGVQELPKRGLDAPRPGRAAREARRRQGFCVDRDMRAGSGS